MAFLATIKTCFAYLSYVALVLWMLLKEYLGYEVDWSKRPPLTPPQKEELDALESQRIILGATSADTTERCSKLKSMARDNVETAGQDLRIAGKNDPWKKEVLG